jgi:hypothetical protein
VGALQLTVKMYSLCKGNFSVIIGSRDYRFYFFCVQSFKLMNFFVNKRENFQINSAIVPAVIMLKVLGPSTKFH